MFDARAAVPGGERVEETVINEASQFGFRFSFSL
jgi:hypothetical protein